MATVDAQIRSIGETSRATSMHWPTTVLCWRRTCCPSFGTSSRPSHVRLQLGDGSAQFHYGATAAAIDWIGSQNKRISFIQRFHKLLQMSASHYTFEGDASERLMLKYYEYLLRTRDAPATISCGIEILGNLEKFPVDLDPSLTGVPREDRRADRWPREHLRSDRGHPEPLLHPQGAAVLHGRAHLLRGHVLELADRMNKFDRIIAFTDIDMTDKYAANLTLCPTRSRCSDQTMPITIIREWEVSIRPCEFDNFAKIFDQSTSGSSS